MRSILQSWKLNVAAERSRLADYLELCKPEVTSLILVATAVGFCAASSSQFRADLLAHTLLGTLLVAAGTAALNQFFERDADGRMRRTDQRPLPAGRMAPGRALAFGVATGAAGVFYLATTTNRLAAGLALLTMLSYLLLYTPLKAKTPASTTVGAFPGAAPPLIGWAAATGELRLGAWVLYAILFLWQFPHFLAIAWMYREDYRRAGFLVLPVLEPNGVSTARRVVFCLLVLLPVSLLPSLVGMAGPLYLAGALLLGLAFFYFGLRLAQTRTLVEARRLLHASVAYLPLLYGLLLVDRGS